MQNLAKSILFSLAFIILVPASASASGGGGTYIPLKGTPADTPVKQTTTETTKTTCQSLTSPTAIPAIDGPDLVPVSPGVYVIDQQGWFADWSGSSYPVPVSYVFEVSDSSAVDSSTGKFTGNIIYSYTGTDTISNGINININETQYFHVIVLASGYCNKYSNVQQITAHQDQREESNVPGVVAPEDNGSNISGPLAGISTIMMLGIIFGLTSRGLLPIESFRLHSSAK